MNAKSIILIIALVVIVAVAATTSGCCCCTNTSGTSDDQSYGASPTTSSSSSISPSATSKPTATLKPTATPRPTATPKPLTGVDLYKTWDTEKIKSEAQRVDWESFIRDPDSYKGQLIVIRGDVVFANEKWSGAKYYTCNVNPNYFTNNIGKGGDNWSPQYVQFDYNTKLISDDQIDMYGVYEGDTTFTDYPIIVGVYCVRYT